MSTRELVGSCIKDSCEVIRSLEAHQDAIAAAADRMVEVLRGGGKVLSAGNGGSAAEALHLAEELVGRFRADRVSLPGISLSADCTTMTCIANDFGFEAVFSRQIEGLGQSGDMLVLFTTSGNSENMVRAMDAARGRGLLVLSLLGKGGGKLAGRGDFEVIVDHDHAERIQEAHQVVMHILLEAVERAFA